MKSLFTTFTFLLFAFAMVAQMTILVDDVPTYFMPQWDNVYLAGNFNSWDPGDNNYIMQQTDQGYSITISGTPGEEVAFKFTRGTWESVETQANGDFLVDRTVVYQDGATMSFQVAAWQDFAGNHTVTNHVLVLDSDQLLPELNRPRRIWVSLPPNYDLNDEHYPVLYLQDGQNVFDSASSFAGEWQVDETMNSLPEICSQAIVVAIDNGEEHRINEYSPWEHPDYGGGEGASYALDLVNHIKPLIDGEFRTLPQREFTGVGGSSLGALIAMFCVLEHQDVFSKAFIASPSFWFSDEVFALANSTSPMADTKIYFVAGNNESASMVPNIDLMISNLFNQGFTNSQMNLLTHDDGQHSEWYWAREFEEGYKWLFDNNGGNNIAAPPSRKQKVWPNPNKGALSVEIEGKIESLGVYNLNGKRELSIAGNGSSHQVIRIEKLSVGGYLLLIKNDQGKVFYERITVE